jgi:hypothetical protein
MDRENVSGMDQEQEYKEELDRLEREGKWGERNHLLLSMFPDMGKWSDFNRIFGGKE